MDREIKFRIWANNQFYYKCLVGNTNDTDDKKYTCPVVWLDDRKEWVNCDNGIISQYTGLKDKNGKDVYEGDKVMYDYEWTEPNEIGIITWNKDTASFQIKGHIPSSSMKHLDRMKVIGNIYE
jgi:uncharacterized phage protein (TIGR01671 family)